MQVLKNDTLLRALLRQPTAYTPIWLMRQAGRYLPEYARTRAQAGSFLVMCKTPTLAAEVTLQPLARYPLDAAILFSDILTIPDAMGLGLHFVEGEGPKLERPVREEADVAKLAPPDPAAQLRYVTDAASEVRRALAGAVPLIGFAGSPYTLACYMVEGGASDDFQIIKTMLYRRPDLLHRMLAINAKAVSALLTAQIEAGAQAVMIFDTWGGSLTDRAYKEFSLTYIEAALSTVPRLRDGAAVPRIVFTKGGGAWLEAIARSGCDCVGLDWTVSLGDARRRIGEQVSLQGNLDPATLLASPDAIRREAAALLQSYGHGSGHVFNLGHGVSQFTPPENVGELVRAVHELSRHYHADR
jgi:uroporphyrinogen decarboxylase